jgi:hypothetical protein
MATAAEAIEEAKVTVKTAVEKWSELERAIAYKLLYEAYDCRIALIPNAIQRAARKAAAS